MTHCDVIADVTIWKIYFLGTLYVGFPDLISNGSYVESVENVKILTQGEFSTGRVISRSIYFSESQSQSPHFEILIDI